MMKKINESFVCQGCDITVPVAKKTCRNHCPQCFLSLHVDGDVPGDRDTECGGAMRPIQYEIRNGETKIHFFCTICHKTHQNKAADDDELGQLDTQIRHWKKKYEKTD